MLHEADIAHSLAHLCRYNGHTKNFYSVAQHCVLMHDHLLKTTSDERLAFTALMHEVAEAYLGDFPGPFKRWLCGDAYFVLEQEIEAVAAEKWNLIHPWPGDVNQLDIAMLEIESNFVMSKKPEPWPLEGLFNVPDIVISEQWTPPKARFEFMKRFKKARHAGVDEAQSGRR